MRVLISPIHYILDKNNSGSEFSWSYLFYKNLCEKKSKDEYFFIAGGVNEIEGDNVNDLKIFNANKIDLSLRNILIFYKKIYFASEKVLKTKKIDIHHHFLPFSINNSFNLSHIFHGKKIKKIIGPVQSNLEISDEDLDIGSARGFIKQKKTSV